MLCPRALVCCVLRLLLVRGRLVSGLGLQLCEPCAEVCGLFCGGGGLCLAVLCLLRERRGLFLQRCDAAVFVLRAGLCLAESLFCLFRALGRGLRLLALGLEGGLLLRRGVELCLVI